MIGSDRLTRKTWILILLVLLLLPLVLWLSRKDGEQEEEGLLIKRKSGAVSQSVVSSVPARPAAMPALPETGFAPQARMGFSVGDQWEPALAADRFGHVYLLYPQYGGVPGCADCYSPSMILQISPDRGKSWGLPTLIYPSGATAGQWDAQIVVDPVDGKTVYAAWLQNGKSDTVVAKSSDFGVNWSVITADSTNAGTDKPILVVRGPDVYVGYNHSQKVWVSVSHDGGASFTSVNINPNAKLGWSLAGGGAIDPAGNIYFSWAGYTRNGGAKGPVYLYVSKSADGGATWSLRELDTSGAPPDCSAYLCGWAFLGAQMTMTSDDAGNLYALWNAGQVEKGAERIYFARSNDAGATWSPKVEVSTAPQGVAHAFPAIAAGNASDVRIAWMDARRDGLWNTFYRSSKDGGTSWSGEADLSTYVPGYNYIQADGFSFPFGDYFEMSIDDQGTSHLVWGEGLNYDSPGSIWYTRGK